MTTLGCDQLEIEFVRAPGQCPPDHAAGGGKRIGLLGDGVARGEPQADRAAHKNTMQKHLRTLSQAAATLAATKCVHKVSRWAAARLPRHSWRSASIGWMIAALKAGMMPKKMPTAALKPRASATDQRGT